MNKPKLIGVTGGIGSGKSTICRIFEVLGCKTYYSDDRAKDLMNNDPDLIAKIKAIFGDTAYEGKMLNRREIANQAFHDKKLIEKLNQAVHPAVRADFEKWVKGNQEHALLLKEAALLFETGSYKELDHTILVVAEEEIRIQRVLLRDKQRTREEVKGIIDKQLSDDKKEPLADFIILNNGKKSVIKQTMEVFAKLS